MAGVDRKIKHYRINTDTGERTLNSDFNIFIILNAVAYLVFLILIFTVGAFGSVSSTTQMLAYQYQSILTPDEVFFKIVWAIVVPWHGFWVVWQIVQAADRNCQGVVRASYFYPFMTIMYAGYTIACRFNVIILGTIFIYGMCGTMIGLIMSMQRYRDKMLPGYMIWQGPMSLLGAWIMVEAMLMTNACFVVLGEEWIIKFVIACVSLVVLFITAIAWLSSYPVDLLVSCVLCYAFGGIYIELQNQRHYGNLFAQGYSNRWLDGAKYTVLAVFLLILVSIFLKILVVLTCQRPKEIEDRQRRKDSRVALSITINTGDNSNSNNNDDNNNRKKSRKNRDRDYDDDNDYDDYDEERPRRKSSNKQNRRGSGDSRQNRRGSNDSRQNRRGSNDSRQKRRGSNGDHRPRRSENEPSSPRKSKTQRKKKEYDDYY